MSCSCGCSPCSCSPSNCNPAPCVIQLPDNPAQELTFENINTAGIGFYDGVESDTIVQFRGLVSESNALIVTYDSNLHAIVIDFDQSLLIADIPTATETQRGIAEIATQAETNAGVVDNVIVTPAKLGARTATETRAGIAEIATQAEVNTGTNDTNFITPLKLATFGGAQLSTTTFADAVARGAKVPAFAGQFGTQIDTGQAYVAGSISAGDWNGIFTLGGTTSTGDGTLNLNGGALIFHSGSFVMNGSMTNTWSGNTTMSNALFSFEDVSSINYNVDTVFKIAGANLSNSSFVGVDAGGAVAEIGFNSFLSGYNTQSGYTTFTNPATIRTLNTATATTQQIAQCLGTLIEDLKVLLLPSS